MRRLPFLGLLGLTLFGTGLLAQLLSTMSSGADLGRRSFTLSSSEISAKTTGTLFLTLPNADILGTLVAEFCINSPLPEDSCIAPAGFDVSSAVLTNQSGPGGFIISPLTSANKVVFTRPPSVASGTVSLELNGIMNPSTPGSYFIRLQTYPTSDATGEASNQGGIAFSIFNALAISALVPPYLLFCTGITIPLQRCDEADGDFIDFGELSAARVSSSSSQMVAATNAIDGYTISVEGTSMASGSNIITPMSTNDISRPGTSQFGLNLQANSAPAAGRAVAGPGIGMPLAAYARSDSYRFVPGERLVATTAPDELREYTASYIVNVSKSQPPGVYVTTLTYICLASF